MADTTDSLDRRLPTDRFEVLDQPYGWRCRACRATVTAPVEAAPPTEREIARLAEAAADHAMFCGRCDD